MVKCFTVSIQPQSVGWVEELLISYQQSAVSYQLKTKDQDRDLGQGLGTGIGDRDLGKVFGKEISF